MRGFKSTLALGGAVGGLLVVTFLVAGGIGYRPAPLRAAGLSAASSASVVINEVAWGGTAASSTDEWIELYNNSDLPLNLSGWQLKAADGLPDIALWGIIPARGYLLLERSDDCAVSDLSADVVFSYGLSNEGERLDLFDNSQTLIDSVDASAGWPAGSAIPAYYTMERIDPSLSGQGGNWTDNNGLVRNGLDCNGISLNGTPKAHNSASYADLRVQKQGPNQALPGQMITYTILLSNAGPLPAPSTWLTDILPAGVVFEGQEGAGSFSQPASGLLLWDLGTVSVTTLAGPLRITITGQIEAGAAGELTNVVTVTAGVTETGLADNTDSVVTMVGTSQTPVVVIESLYAQTYDGIYDEAIRLMNSSTVTATIGDWMLSDGDGVLTFPPGISLGPGQRIWCSRDSDSFAASFGFTPDYEWAGTDPAVPDLTRAGTFVMNDDGDEVSLLDAHGVLVDLVVYGEDTATGEGWTGPAVQAYNPTSTFPTKGQVLYRRRDQQTGLPVADTDTSADWAQDRADVVNGRRVLYPGWDLDAFFWTARVTETAVLTVAIAPDHLLNTVLTRIENAKESIWIEGYTFESPALAQALLDRLNAGVRVTMLLEGGPAGGISDAERWICGQISAAGGHVYFLSGDYIHPRYRAQHAKLLLIDDRIVLIGSENLGPTGMPSDDKSDGTAGRRGVFLLTNAPGVVLRVQQILAADIDPVSHSDIVSCADVPSLCAGVPPLSDPNWTSYTVAFTEPLTVRGEFAFEVVQSPENSLRDQDGLLGLLGRAGSGDTILVEQFYESDHWGAIDATPESDPNLRLEAYLAAARRGASVRVLLDDYFEAAENTEAMAYLLGVTGRDGLDVQVRLGNPTYLGLHNKMVLAQVNGSGYVHVGSINGGEVASKANREVALQVQSDGAYDYLKSVFEHDWRSSPVSTYLPSVFRMHEAPQPADYLLIDELYYRAAPEAQWVEVYNPTRWPLDLSAYKIGDAAIRGDYEGMYRFPAGAMIGPRQVVVVAANAGQFRSLFPGQSPHFEIVESDLTVPNMIKYIDWAEGDLWLRRDGDEMVLLDGGDHVVDAVIYGDSTYPLVIPHPGVESGHSLERYPIWLDTDDCSSDLRDQPYPNPTEYP